MTVPAILTSAREEATAFLPAGSKGVLRSKKKRGMRGRARDDELPTPPEEQDVAMVSMTTASMTASMTTASMTASTASTASTVDVVDTTSASTASTVDTASVASAVDTADTASVAPSRSASRGAEDELEVAQVLSGMRASPSASFFARVSSLPVVTSTMRTVGEVYEQGKASSRVIKRSAETVESLLSTTHSALEPQIGQLDQFACRQLDRIGHQASLLDRWAFSWNADSLRSLKHCVDWLRSATTHIDQQIHLLKDALNAIVTNLHHSSSASAQHLLHNLIDVARTVKKEVAETLRKVVDVVGSYASVGLPLEAKNRIRGFILGLPSRWANINHQDASVNGHQVEAERVLTLAEESNRMLQGIQSVFCQTVDAAETWVGRFSWGSSAAASKNEEEPMEE